MFVADKMAVRQASLVRDGWFIFESGPAGIFKGDMGGGEMPYITVLSKGGPSAMVRHQKIFW